MKKILSAVLAICMILALVPAFAVTVAAAGETVVFFERGSVWKYQLSTRSEFDQKFDPENNDNLTEYKDWWKDISFDDSSWDENDNFADGSEFNTTMWTGGTDSPDVYETEIHDLMLRKVITVDDISALDGLSLCSYLRIDDNVHIYINGVEVYEYEKWNSDYIFLTFGLADELLKEGDNLIAITVEDGHGGRYFDMELFAYAAPVSSFEGKTLIDVNSVWEYHVSSTADYSIQENADWTLSSFAGEWESQLPAPYGDRSSSFNRSDIGWTKDGKNFLYVRQEFEVTAQELASYNGKTLSMLSFYDDTAHFYLNGKEVFTNVSSDGAWNDYYENIALGADASALLKEGTNVFAVSLEQHSGGYEFDTALYVEPDNTTEIKDLTGKQYIASEVTLSEESAGLVGSVTADVKCLGKLENIGDLTIFINGEGVRFESAYSQRPNGSETTVDFVISDYAATPGEELEFLFVFGAEGWFTVASTEAPDNDSAVVKSSHTTLLGGKLSATIEFEEQAANKYSVGDKISFSPFDSDDTYTAEVTASSGASITIEAYDVDCGNKYLNFGAGTGTMFAIGVDEYATGACLGSVGSGNFAAYMQTGNTDFYSGSVRFIVVGNRQTIFSDYASGKIVITFKSEGSTVKTYSMSMSRTYYKTVIADGEYFNAASDDIISGVIITEIPHDEWEEAVLEVIKGSETVYSAQIENYAAEKIEQKYEIAEGITELSSDGNNISSATEGISMMFDNDYTTKYGDGGGSGDILTITWTFEEAFVPKAYIVVTGGDTSKYPDRNPVSWKLYGSSDGEEWTLISDIVSPGLEAVDSTPYGYGIYESSEYSHYKLEVRKTNSSTFFQLSEFTLYK